MPQPAGKASGHGGGWFSPVAISMSFFRLDASIRSKVPIAATSPTSSSRSGATPTPATPSSGVTSGIEPLPATAWATAVIAGFTPEDERAPTSSGPCALAATLTDELVEADALLFAVPLYNFGVSQHFKTWVDLVITDPRMAAGTEPAWRASRPCW